MADKTEVLYPDGSLSTYEGGGSFHEGVWAIERFRLIAATQALRVYIGTQGRMQVTANGAHLAIVNVIEPLTGKRYKRSMKGKQEALEDALSALAQIDAAAVVVVTDNDTV
jgi:hypothetical protein